MSGRRHVSEGALMLFRVEFLPLFQSCMNRVHLILALLSRQLDLCSTSATRSLSTLAPLPHLHVFSRPVVPSQLGCTNSLGSGPKVRYDFPCRRPGRRLVPSSTRPCNQNDAVKGYLPRLHTSHLVNRRLIRVLNTRRKRTNDLWYSITIAIRCTS